MRRVIEISPECPICKIHHSQSFAWEQLYELLQDAGAVNHFYCPRLDKRWPASHEDRERLAHIAAVFSRLCARQSQPDSGTDFNVLR
jgi:hypothetical protein